MLPKYFTTNNRTQNKSIYIILIASFTIFGLLSCNLPTVTPSPTPFPLQRKIVSKTLPLLEKWRVEIGPIPSYSRPPLVHTKLGILSANSNQLALLDNETGQVIWQQKQEGRGVDSVIADQETAYLSIGHRIIAYQLTDGHLLWQTERQTGNRSYHLYLEDGLLVAYERPARDADDVIHTFDPNTGLKIDTTTYFSPDGSYLDTPLEQVNLRRNANTVQAVDADTNRTLWNISVDNSDDLIMPIVLDKFLVMTVGRIELDLLVIELDSGNILWAKSGFASNPVVQGNVVYAIRADANINAYDLATGQELGNVNIDPSVTNRHQHNYVLVSDEGNRRLYAYFDDTKELIAFDSISP